MNSNGTANPSNGGRNYELTIALVALAVSAFALVIALFQALQQYYASATGYASCKELVIGEWSKFTRRRPQLFEFRFEVEFRTPVIFVSAPSNKRGPLGPHPEKGKPHAGKRSIPSHLKRFVESKFAWFQPPEVACHEITYMVGTERSYLETHTWSQEKYDQQIRKREARDTRQGIRTADNELASWLALLMAVQRMEKESRQWQEEHYPGYNPSGNGWHTRASHEPLPDNFDNTDANNLHTLTVGIQKKKRSWDTMPGHIKKPYATSTICHIVEILAMLGIHWKVFNRNENRYRAQGNGFIVTGANVDGLGIVFSFHKAGETWFEENRIIPDNNVKELCFGYCPTIFRPRRFKMYADEPKDLGTLQLASFAAMAETLVVIGCNTKTVKYFSKPAEHTRYSHLFPVAFEMLGMVGIVLQIKGTAFRMLPNPTIHHWDRKSFSLRTLLITYKSILDKAAKYQKQEAQGETQNAQAMFHNSNQISKIISKADKIEKAFSESEQRIRDSQPRQNQEQGQEEFTTTRPETRQRTEEQRLHCRNLMTTLHTAIERCDEFLKDPRETLVQSVLRVHLQEVLGILNLRDTDHGPTHRYRKVMLRNLQRLDSASYRERHTVLMNIYIFSVRENVIRKICSELNRERRRQQPWNQAIRIQRTGTLLESPLNGDEDDLDDDRVEVEDYWAYVKLEEKQEINDVWCVLVFRMMCWLLLHDFHKMDVQIDKDGFFGSRLPVYIA